MCFCHCHIPCSNALYNHSICNDAFSVRPFSAMQIAKEGLILVFATIITDSLDVNALCCVCQVTANAVMAVTHL